MRDHTLVQKFISFYWRHHKFAPAAAFACGLIFDTISLDRIDHPLALIQQGIYLVVATLVLMISIRMNNAEDAPERELPRALKPAWRYRDEIFHFLLGSLLSAYTVLYLKSSSIVGSALFFLVIITLLVGNELQVLRRLGLPFRFALLTLCLASYLIYLIPILWGQIGVAPFLTAVVITGLIVVALMRSLVSQIPDDTKRFLQFVVPGLGTLLIVVYLYALKVIPPVPVSLKHIGIYHHVERVADGYLVRHERSRWKFWQVGDQDYKARRGDRIYCFFAVYSPVGFEDKLRVRWLRKDSKRGWVGSDAIPVSIVGGRGSGYRGYTFKAHYQPGDWRVQIETSDGREIGRISLAVLMDDDQNRDRSFSEEVL